MTTVFGVASPAAVGDVQYSLPAAPLAMPRRSIACWSAPGRTSNKLAHLDVGNWWYLRLSPAVGAADPVGVYYMSPRNITPIGKFLALCYRRYLFFRQRHPFHSLPLNLKRRGTVAWRFRLL